MCVGEKSGNGENLRESNPHTSSLPALNYLRNYYFSSGLRGRAYIKPEKGKGIIYVFNTSGVVKNGRIDPEGSFFFELLGLIYCHRLFDCGGLLLSLLFCTVPYG